MMCALRRQIEKVGNRISRPYVSLGTKRKDEGDMQANGNGCMWCGEGVGEDILRSLERVHNLKAGVVGVS